MSIHGYTTHTENERQAMLDIIGLNTIEDLFGYIPDTIRLHRDLDLPTALSEWELEKHMNHLSSKNDTTKTHSNFIGNGMYEHYIPAVIDAIASRSEFLTSYTPYQPEMSQGLLQSLYEYQHMLSSITGLPVVNGSCYDGATAFADAAWVSCCIAKESTHATHTDDHHIVIADSISEQYQHVIHTYMQGRGVTVHTLPTHPETGQIDHNALEALLAEVTPDSFLFQSPNRFGVLEDIATIVAQCKKHNVLSVASWNPICSGLLTSPGEYDVDIVTCEGQSLGIPMSAGGASLGIFATKTAYKPYIPGRIVGLVRNIKNALAYALVSEEREQHVARENSTSNICSNQANNALRATLFLASLGSEGLKKLATFNVKKARYLRDKLAAIDGVSLPFYAHNNAHSIFNEFTILLPKCADKVIEALYQRGIFAGVDISKDYQKLHPDSSAKGALLIAVTETKSKAELDAYADALADVLAS